jgi:hypothetical protein
MLWLILLLIKGNRITVDEKEDEVEESFDFEKFWKFSTFC